MHPPSEPSIPENVVAYGSAKGALDKAEAAANWSEAGWVAAYFDGKGFSFSSTLFGFYLGDHGPNGRYVLNADQVRKVVATNDVKAKAQTGLDQIKNMAKSDPQFGTTRELTTDWILTYPTDDPDVANSLAHFSIAIGSDTTVKNAGEGSELSAHIDYAIYIYDYYNFDQPRKFTTDIEYSLKTNVDADMRQLEAAGWARSFRVSGDTRNVIPLSWEGHL